MRSIDVFSLLIGYCSIQQQSSDATWMASAAATNQIASSSTDPVQIQYDPNSGPDVIGPLAGGGDSHRHDDDDDRKHYPLQLFHWFQPLGAVRDKLNKLNDYINHPNYGGGMHVLHGTQQRWENWISSVRDAIRQHLMKAPGAGIIEQDYPFAYRNAPPN